MPVCDGTGRSGRSEATVETNLEYKKGAWGTQAGTRDSDAQVYKRHMTLLSSCYHAISTLAGRVRSSHWSWLLSGGHPPALYCLLQRPSI